MIIADELAGHGVLGFSCYRTDSPVFLLFPPSLNYLCEQISFILMLCVIILRFLRHTIPTVTTAGQSYPCRASRQVDVVADDRVIITIDCNESATHAWHIFDLVVVSLFLSICRLVCRSIAKYG